MTTFPLRSGAQVLVDQLRIHQVQQIFCVPGESYLAVLDALYDAPDMQVTVCRQEGGAAMMAEACGKLTGQPAACFVTRGPGISNAIAGMHIAQHDGTPLLVFVGQIERSMRHRGAFQELDYRQAMNGLAKWTVEIDSAERIPELVGQAMRHACSGRPGPVVIALPEDMLLEEVAIADGRFLPEPELYPSQAQIQQIVTTLAQAKRPVCIIGGVRWTETACQLLSQALELLQVPTIISMRRQMLLSVEHPCFIGDLGFGPNPEIVKAIQDADVVLSWGARLAEVPSQSYSLLSIPKPAQTFIHIDTDPIELGKVYHSDISVVCTPEAGLNALVTELQSKSTSLPKRAQYIDSLRQSYLKWSDPSTVCSPGALQMSAVMQYLNQKLPNDAILCNGAGNYATWIHRFYHFRQFATQLAPTSGSMGYGVPAAIGALRLMPEKTVVAFAGDGCFLMHGQEFATAVQYQLPLIVLVIDNGMYGTIRMHQEREYPGRVVATTLQNPDFAAYARAFGGKGYTVHTAEEFAQAFDQAVSEKVPAILHCLLDPQAITPSSSLDNIRAAAQKRLNQA